VTLRVGASSMATQTCGVCADDFFGSPLNCAHCKYSCCGKCATRYWSDKPYDAPACMACRKTLSAENLEECFTKTFVKTGLDNARRESLFNAEKGLFLQTQQELFPVVHVYETMLASIEKSRVDLRALEEKHYRLRLESSDIQREYLRQGGSKNAQNTLYRSFIEAVEAVGELTLQIDASNTAMMQNVRVAEKLYEMLMHEPLEFSVRRMVRYVTMKTFDTKYIDPSIVNDVSQRFPEFSFNNSLNIAAANADAAVPAHVFFLEERREENQKTSNEAKKRMAPCTRDGCLGMYSTDSGTCMVCQAHHCAKCAKLLELPNADPTPDDDKIPESGDKDAGAPRIETSSPGFTVSIVPADTGAAKKKKALRHVCNPEDVATVRYLNTTTKACPRCHYGIQRESGCAQMMCIKCNTVFNWNTMQEERGVIHNPHFYTLGAEARQRIVDERASRGIMSGREERFLAGVRPRVVCDANMIHDPLCMDFNSTQFLNLLENALKDDKVLVRVALELHRETVHFMTVESPRLADLLNRPSKFGEQRTRPFRLAHLRGGRPIHRVETLNQTLKTIFRSSCVVIVDQEKMQTTDYYKKQLMRIDTERTKTAKHLELVQTFAAASEDTLRVALASPVDECKTLVRSVIRMKKDLDKEIQNVLSGRSQRNGRTANTSDDDEEVVITQEITVRSDAGRATSAANALVKKRARQDGSAGTTTDGDTAAGAAGGSGGAGSAGGAGSMGAGTKARQTHMTETRVPPPARRFEDFAARARFQARQAQMAGQAAPVADLGEDSSESEPF